MMNERIKERRKANRLTQPELGKMIGVTKATISLWEAGATSPKGENLYALAKALNCTSEYLLFGEEQRIKPESNAEWAGSVDAWDNLTPLEEDEVEIPFYMGVKLSAGNGVSECTQYYGPKRRFSRSMLRRHGVNITDALVIKIVGDSMDPVLPDGSTVGIDMSKTNIIDGKMYAIEQGDMLRIKRLYKLPGGGIRIRSYNTDDYPDEHLTFEETKDLKILGKIWWRETLD